MYLLSKPTATDLQKYLAQQSKQTFSYEEIGFSLKIGQNGSDYLPQIRDRYTLD